MTTPRNPGLVSNLVRGSVFGLAAAGFPAGLTAGLTVGLTAGVTAGLSAGVTAQADQPQAEQKQGEQKQGILPADPLLTVHIDGPAALRAAFLPTNVGMMFAGPEFKDMVAPVLEMLEQMKQQAGGKLPFDPDAFHKAVLNYGGRVSAAFHVLDDNIDFGSPNPPDFAVTIAMSPDGKTDLAGFCKTARSFAKEKAGDALRDVDVAGTSVSYVLDDASGVPGVSTPFMFRDHAVILITKDFKKAAAAVVGQDAKRHEMDARDASASIGISLNLERLLTLLAAGVKHRVGPMWDVMGAHIYKGSGLQSLRSLTIAARAQGPAVLSEQTIRFNGKDRGVLGGLFPVQATKSKLIDLLPRAAIAASAMPFDIKEIYKGIKTVFAEMGDNAPMQFADMEEQFKQEFGIRLFEDLIGLFGGSLMTVQMEAGNLDGGSMLGPMDGMGIGFDVGDGPKLAKSIDTMLRKAGLHAGRKKTAYKGFDVYELMIAGMVEVHYAVSDNLFLLGLGAAGGDPVRGALDEAKNRAEGKQAAEFGTAIKSRLAMVKGSFTGLGWSDAEAQMEGMSAQLDEMAGSLPPQFDLVAGMLAKLPGMLKTYKLKYQVTFIRTEASSWSYSSVW